MLNEVKHLTALQCEINEMDSPFAGAQGFGSRAHHANVLRRGRRVTPVCEKWGRVTKDVVCKSYTSLCTFNFRSASLERDQQHGNIGGIDACESPGLPDCRWSKAQQHLPRLVAQALQ